MKKGSGKKKKFQIPKSKTQNPTKNPIAIKLIFLMVYYQIIVINKSWNIIGQIYQVYD